MRKPCESGVVKATTTPCCSKVGLKRGPWTAEEDEVLSKFIEKEGEGRWRTLPKRAGLLRCGKSCRLRWMNYLRPSVKRGHIAPDEEDLILRLHRLLGNRWSLIAGRIPGRTDNEIKNYWNTHLSKKLISQGIDPRTHKPLPPSTSNHSKFSTSTTTPIQHQQHHAHALNNNNNNNNNITSYEPRPHPDDEALLQPPGGGYGNGIIIPDNTNTNTDDDVIDEQIVQQEEEEEEDINYCSDDVFSSFLNSLINEDAFLHSHPPTSPSPNNTNIHAFLPPLPSQTTSPPSSTHHNNPIHPSSSSL